MHTYKVERQYAELVIALLVPTYIMKIYYGHLEFEFGVESIYEVDRMDMVVTSSITGIHQRRILSRQTRVEDVVDVVYGFMEELEPAQRVSKETIMNDITAFIPPL